MPHWASSCSYTSGSNCYKETDTEMSWREARRQCWLWGGDLAFPLDNATSECDHRIFFQNTEEVYSTTT